MGLSFDGVDSLVIDQQSLMSSASLIPNGGATSLVNPDTGFVTLDCAAYQHVILQFQKNAGSVTFGAQDYVEFRWSPGNGLGFIRERMYLGSKTLTVANNTISVALPVRGMAVQVLFNLPGASSGVDSVALIGSYRPAPPMTQWDGIIASYASVAMPVGNAFGEFVFPYRGKAHLHMGASAAAGVAVCIMSDFPNQREQIISNQYNVIFGAAGVGETQVRDILIPFQFSRVRFANLGGAPQNAFFMLIADGHSN
jgi:hypothetical protein